MSTSAIRMAAMRERNKKKGLTRVEVYVPKGGAPAIRKLAAKLRKASK